MADGLSGTQLLAAASNVLGASGYMTATMPSVNESTAYISRVFEDPFGIVAICIFESWGRLVEEWAEAQGQLVDLMSDLDPRVVA